MTPDPGRSAASRAPAGRGRSRPGSLTHRMWAYGPYLAVFLVVFGGALFLLGDASWKIVGASIMLPGGLGGALLLFAANLGMSGRGWGSRTRR
ncbi:hypothetical protein ACVXZ4_06570 [Lacisediminihabitans sp. FW035]